MFQRARVITSSAPPAPIENTEQTERAIGADFVPREIFKFELADAKIPDFVQNTQHQRYQTRKPNSRPRQRKSRKHETTTSTITENDQNTAKSNDNNQQESSTSQSTSSDQSGSDSRLLHIAHPISSTFESQRHVKQLPFSVQKAINHALKSDYNLPYLDTVKYYFKDPVPRTSKLASVTSNLPAGAKLFSDSRIKQWWQLPPQYKSSTLSPFNLNGKISSTTIKPSLVSVTTLSPFSNDYVAYPLLRSYPVQYSMNVASDLVNGVSFLYGDRIYAKPYSSITYQKNTNKQVNSDVKPIIEVKPSEDEIVNGVYRSTPTTPSSIFSTSPVVFPLSSTEPPKKHQTFFKYYSAESPIPTNPDTGVPLSTDKNTIQLINKAVSELKKHNPHLHVVPKRVENNDLIVHVTPKPEYYKKPTTPKSIVSVSEALKDIVTDKNLVYLNKVTELNDGNPSKDVNPKHTVAYVTHIELPHNIDDLV